MSKLDKKGFIFQISFYSEKQIIIAIVILFCHLLKAFIHLSRTNVLIKRIGLLLSSHLSDAGDFSAHRVGDALLQKIEFN